MDLDDLEHNTRDGLHIASLAGSWIALVAGFGGMRHRGGHPGLRAAAARGAEPARLHGQLRGRRLRVEMTGRPPPTPCWTVPRWRSATTGSRSPSRQEPRVSRRSRHARARTDTHATTRPRTGPSTALNSTSDDHSTDDRAVNNPIR